MNRLRFHGVLVAVVLALAGFAAWCWSWVATADDVDPLVKVVLAMLTATVVGLTPSAIRGMVKAAAAHRRWARLSPAARRSIAAHEAAHALVSLMLPDARDPDLVTIGPDSENGVGWTRSRATVRSRMCWTADRVKAELAVKLAGSVGERVAIGSRSVSVFGGERDTAEATDLALRAVCQGNMGSSPRHVNVEQWASDPENRQIASDVRELLEVAKATASGVLTDHRGVLTALTAMLLERHTMSGDDVRAVVSGAVTADRGLGKEQA